MSDIVKQIIRDVAVNLHDEFDQNFERKAFFDKPWAQTKMHNPTGSLMARSGNLRNSLRYSISDDSIHWESSMPYASVHNEGGKIEVTTKMKAFFWAMYYKASGAVTGGTQRDINLSAEALQWKNLALMPLGKIIQMEERRFIGDHSEVKYAIEYVMEETLPELEAFIAKKLKK